MRYGESLENRKMAIINLTCDFPFEYSISELSRWSKINPRLVSRLCSTLDLDVCKGEKGMFVKKEITGRSKYLKFTNLSS